MVEVSTYKSFENAFLTGLPRAAGDRHAMAKHTTGARHRAVIRARGSFQPLSKPKELIGHDADSQQHQQRHDDGGTHSFILCFGGTTAERAEARRRLHQKLFPSDSAAVLESDG